MSAGGDRMSYDDETKADLLAGLVPPDDVVRAVQAIHGGCSRDAALLIIENDVRELLAAGFTEVEPLR